jgi:hypothetical protein
VDIWATWSILVLSIPLFFAKIFTYNFQWFRKNFKRGKEFFLYVCEVSIQIGSLFGGYKLTMPAFIFLRGTILNDWLVRVGLSELSLQRYLRVPFSTQLWTGCRLELWITFESIHDMWFVEPWFFVLLLRTRVLFRNVLLVLVVVRYPLKTRMPKVGFAFLLLVPVHVLLVHKICDFELILWSTTGSTTWLQWQN